MKNAKTIILCFLLLLASCTGDKQHGNNIKSQLQQALFSQAITLTGTDANDNQTSSGVYGNKIIVNVMMDLNYVSAPTGTEFVVTPEFANKSTEVPNNDTMSWSFLDGQKSITVQKGVNDHYTTQLIIIVKPSLKYYYHNFSVNMLATRTDTKAQSRSKTSIEVNVFGLMTQNAIGKVYLGSYDYYKNQYQMPNLIGYPAIRDDGQMLLNKLITNNNPSLYPDGLQEVMITAYKDDHTEVVLGQPDIDPNCFSSDYSLIGNFVYNANSG